MSAALPAGSHVTSTAAAAAASIGVVAAAVPLAASLPTRRPADWRWLQSGVLLLLLFASLLLFVLLPERPLVSQGVYIDEHSVMTLNHDVSMVRATMVAALTDTERELRRVGSNGSSDDVHAFLRTRMRRIGMQVGEFVHRHDDSPLQPLDDDVDATTAGSSLNTSLSSSPPSCLTYGVWRAPRSDGKECIMLVTEFDVHDLIEGGASATANHNVGAPSFSGVSTLLNLLTHWAQVHGHLYYARDVVLVFVERGATGAGTGTSTPSSLSRTWSKQRAVDAFGAFVHAYHSGDASIVRGGRILATLVLDIPIQRMSGPSSSYSSFSLDAVGFYGLMPNLDYPSMLFPVFSKFQLPIAVAETGLQRDPLDEIHAAASAADDAASTDPHSLSALLHPFTSFLATHAPFLRKSFFSVHNVQNEREAFVNLDPWGVLTPVLHELLGGPGALPRTWPLFSTNLARWKGLWRFLLQSLACGASTYHAHANRLAIDALTIAAVPDQPSSSSSRAPRSVAARDTMGFDLLRSLDSFLRSVNNAHEKLHHTTWWYLLNNSSDFVTMSKYIYVAVLPLGAVALLALARLSSSIGGFSPPIHSTMQRFAHSVGLVAAIYALCLVHFFSVDAFIASVGGGRWNRRAMRAWMAFVAASWAMFFFVLLPLCSQRRTKPSRRDAEASVLLLPPRNLVQQEAAATRALALAAQLKKKTKKPDAAATSEPAPLPLSLSRGLELPLSPAGLPLLRPCDLSPSTPAPIYSSSWDWRVLHALISACAVACLAPCMVLNTAACALTLLFLAPLVFAARAAQWPAQWLPFFRRLHDVHGRPLQLGLSGSLVWQTAKYLLHLLLHLFSLVLCSPLTLLLLYSHFHVLSIDAALDALLLSLARAPTNILAVTAFFAYWPAYVASILMITCRFQLHERPVGASPAGAAGRSKTE
jgi:hypothetical protein